MTETEDGRDSDVINDVADNEPTHDGGDAP